MTGSTSNQDVRFVCDEDVAAVIEGAATAACHELDSLFPGQDSGGICSHFVGVLQDALRHMLTGRSVLDAERGHAVALPRLVLDDPCPVMAHAHADAYLAVVADDLVLSPGRLTLTTMERAQNAWASYDDAATAARDYVRAHANSLTAAERFRVRIIPVAPLDGADGGFRLATTSNTAAA